MNDILSNSLSTLAGFYCGNSPYIVTEVCLKISHSSMIEQRIFFLLCESIYYNKVLLGLFKSYNIMWSIIVWQQHINLSSKTWHTKYHSPLQDQATHTQEKCWHRCKEQTSQVPNNWWQYVLLSHGHEGMDHEPDESGMNKTLMKQDWKYMFNSPFWRFLGLTTHFGQKLALVSNLTMFIVFPPHCSSWTW